jgi:hypothetical protein
MSVSVLFEAVYSDRVQWVLDRVESADYDLLRRCILALEQDPYPPASQRAPLVIPGQRTYPDSFRCEGWRIAFHVEDDAFVIIDDVGRWPPAPPGSS